MSQTASATPRTATDLFQAHDHYLVDELLTEEQKMIRDTVRQHVSKHLKPVIEERFEKAEFSKDIIPGLADVGAFGPFIPAEYGGPGLDQISYGLIMQEIERCDSGLRSLCSVQGSLAMYPIWKYGSEEQKKKWLPDMVQGKKIGCFGLTEPDGGSDPGAMKTTARKTGGDWVLSGAKMWITNGTIADIAIVWAMTDAGVRGFLVERGMPGYTTRDIHHKFSLRASITSELFFDNVRVPEANRLPLAEGLGAPLSCLTQARYGIAWGGVGAAIACYREALAFARQRVLFGEPLIHKQAIQVRLADMLRRITTGQLLALQLGRLKDAGTMHHAQVSLAKWNNVRLGLDVARDARDLLGAGGISVECCPIRHMLNLESVITYEGTETIHQLIVGREITGVSAF